MRARIKCALLVFGMVVSAGTWALSSDRYQPMQIDADHADIDQQQGTSVYRGNVRLARGSMVLLADEVTVKQDHGNVRLVVATGSPASYRQRSDKQQDIRASAQRMEYHVDTGQLLLIKQAELHQDANVFASERIVYDSVADRVNAGANATTPEGRVHIVIQPGSLPASGATPAPTASPTPAPQ